MSSLGYKRCDNVTDKVETREYAVTPGEPKNVFDTKDEHVLPLLRLGALPGARWEWDSPKHAPGERLYHVFKYVRAVRHQRHECVLIVRELHGRSPRLGDMLLERVESWYVKGVGMVKEDQYVSLGNEMMHLGAKYLVGRE
jgi:hypothetical protein